MALDQILWCSHPWINRQAFAWYVKKHTMLSKHGSRQSSSPDSKGGSCIQFPWLQEAVEDTTGAGDAFIGTILYGIIHKLLYDQMLRLAAVVAACKCTALGARPGLPHAEDIDADLLTA